MPNNSDNRTIKKPTALLSERAKHTRANQTRSLKQTKAHQALHFRRCHVCNSVTESEQQISRCQSCLKPMAPFYYFDVCQTTVYTDDRCREPHSTDGYAPIQGLVVRW